MTLKEITVALIAILFSLGCAERNFESKNRQISSPEPIENRSDDSIIDPENPDMIIESLGEGNSNFIDSILGGLGGILDSLVPGTTPKNEKVPTNICSENLNLILVFDASDSMDKSTVGSSETKIDAAKRVAADFFDDLSLKSNDSLGLIPFHQTVLRDSVINSQTKDSLINQVRTIETFKQPNPSLLQHNTHMSEGLTGAYNMLKPKDSHTNVVILLSDGFPNLPRGSTLNPFDNKHAIEEAIKASAKIKMKDTIIFTIGFDFENDAGLLSIIASDPSYNFNANSPEALRSAYRDIENKLCR